MASFLLEHGANVKAKNKCVHAPARGSFASICCRTSGMAEFLQARRDCVACCRRQEQRHHGTPATAARSRHICNCRVRCACVHFVDLCSRANLLFCRSSVRDRVTRLCRGDLTALHFAAHQNRSEITLLLLQNSADVHAKDRKYAHAQAARCICQNNRTPPLKAAAFTVISAISLADK